jgi:hypothetical protein
MAHFCCHPYYTLLSSVSEKEKNMPDCAQLQASLDNAQKVRAAMDDDPDQFCLDECDSGDIQCIRNCHASLPGRKKALDEETARLQQEIPSCFTAVYAQGDPGSGIGGYDLLKPADQAFAFDYDSSGKLDHLVLYRPGTGTIWILRKG